VKWFAIGDPQTSAERFLSVIERLRGADGMLRSDVGLVSMGDHFDFHGERAEPDGREILSWLARHSPEQVIILAGNHDLARVMELAFETDASYAEARALAKSGSEEEFHARFPRIPTPGIVLRDYSSFSEAQRALVQELLLAGRFRLAMTAKIEGFPALLTHAAVTTRETAMLGVDDAHTIVAALEERFALAIDAVRDAWTRGEHAALDLSPLHVAGTAGREGGGLLYHRPSRRDRPGADVEWEHDPESPRRFEPSELPAQILQVAGHTTHEKCKKELTGWIEATDDWLAIRTLVGGDPPRYVGGVVAGPGNLVLIDPHFAKAPLESIELLEISCDD